MHRINVMPLEINGITEQCSVNIVVVLLVECENFNKIEINISICAANVQ